MKPNAKVICRSPGDAALFTEWQEYAELFRQQGAIMQEPRELTFDEIISWLSRNHDIISKFPDLVARTYTVIYNHTDPEERTVR